MLVGTGDWQNVFAFVAGLVFAALGASVIWKRVDLALFFADVQSRAGALGRRVARENRPWVYIMVGAGCSLFGVALIVMGLFAHIAPPGSAR